MLRAFGYFIRRALRNRGLWITLLLLTLAGLVVSGGVTHRNLLNQELMILNAAFDVEFPTLEEFTAWFNLHQFRWLMGATGQMCLFPVVAGRFPRGTEFRTPVVLGLSRGRVLLGAVLCYGMEILVLSLSCTAAAAVASGLRLTAEAGYYLRCLVLHLWRDLGYGGLALTLALLLRGRTGGMILSFCGMALLASAVSGGIVTGLPTLFGRMREQYRLWMWELQPAPTPGQVLTLALFPVVTFALAVLVGFLRCRGDLEKGGRA